MGSWGSPERVIEFLTPNGGFMPGISQFADVNRWVASAPKMLDLPTPDGSGQATHPSVVHIPGGLNGFEYWMAMTPYPYSNDSEENPNILASNDGEFWVVPDGLNNPIDRAPGYPGAYNSDTNLVFDGGHLILTWRQVSPDLRKSFFMATSVDGVSWSPKVVVANTNLLSQALVRIDTGWRIYGIEPRSGENRFVFWETSHAVPSLSGWGPRRQASLPIFGPDFEPWHVEVQRFDGEFIGLLNTTEFNRQGYGGSTHLMYSSDGIEWAVAARPLWPRSGLGYDAHYKSGFAIKTVQQRISLDVFAAVVKSDTPRVWRIGRTEAFLGRYL